MKFVHIGGPWLGLRSGAQPFQIWNMKMQLRKVTSFWALSLTLALGLVAPSAAQLRGPGLVSGIEAKRNGLERRWFSQVQLDVARTRVVGVVLQVSSTDATTIYEIKHKGGKARFASNQFNHLGKEIGDAGAKALAERKMLFFQAAGLEPKLNRLVQPEITLYASTDRGMIHAIDGESGRTKWRAIIGDPKHPTLTPAANDRYVAAVNGSYLYMLDRNTGKQLWRRKVVSAPGAGPAVSENMAFVPMVNGKVESFTLADYKTPTGVFQSIGRAMVRPILTSNNVVWPTDRGHLYVAPSSKKGIHYRIEAHDSIVSPAAFQPPNTLYTVSIDGYAYSIHESTGRLNWSYSIGEQLSREPIPLGKHLLVITDLDNMIALDKNTGEPVWKTPQIRGYLSASQDRIYALNEIGRLTILDRKSGSVLASMPTEELDLHFINQLTDRIYIGTKRGLIQCLHEPRNEFPIMRQDEPTEEEAPAGDKPAGDGGKDNPFAPDAGGGDNPFAPKKDDDDNPFAPGGGGAKKAEDNPFGL